ncbi:MAG: hypothetical protein WCP79_02710 [Bacillota bacterium]
MQGLTILGMPWTELVGILASVLVLVSFLTTQQLRLRMINLVGCATWVTYGLLIGAFSVWFMNLLVGIIQIRFLVQYFSEKYRFWFVNCQKDDGLLNVFIDTNFPDIHVVQPGFLKKEIHEGAKCFYITRENEIAGAFILNPVAGAVDSYDPILWYMTKKFRDHNIGKDIYEETKLYFEQHSIRHIVAKNDTERYNQYLIQSGYVFDAENKEYFLQ